MTIRSKTLLQIAVVFSVIVSSNAAPLNNAGTITATGGSNVVATNNVIANNTMNAQWGITTNNGNIVANGGGAELRAQANVKAVGGFVSAATYGSFGSYVYATSFLQTAGYVTASGSGNFGTTLTAGGSSIVGGVNSGIALGAAAQSPSYSCVSVGQFNKTVAKDDSSPSGSAWVGKDPLFLVGNGTSSANKSNALAVYKDGTVTMSKAQGDILMGQFGN